MKVFSFSLFGLTLFALALTVRSADAPRSGAVVYQTYCGSCHSGGWQGAPVANDKKEWDERLAKGFDAVFNNAKQGLNGMPPMGTCMDCTDEELKASIQEMLAF